MKYSSVPRISMGEILNTPWKITNYLIRVICTPLVWFLLYANGINWKNPIRPFGLPIIQKHKNSIMQFGFNMELRSTASSNPIGVNHPVFICTWSKNSILTIGNDFGMTGGSIIASEKITIGDRVSVGANTIIIDTDFHLINPLERDKHPKAFTSKPVVIEDDVFIGMNSNILKGVTLGKGSVIGAGSVVTKSIPPYTIAAGNPAKVIRNIF